MAYEDVTCRFLGPAEDIPFVELECERLHRRIVPVTADVVSNGARACAQSFAATKCPECGNTERLVAVGWRPGFDQVGLKLEPGDIFFAPSPHEGGRCPDVIGGWTNCSGEHLHVVLPNGHIWNVDERAANCTMPEDGEHRCWVRHGDPPHITVNKDGNTCAAGRGSVKSGDFHGYLIDGKLVDVAHLPG